MIGSVITSYVKAIGRAEGLVVSNGFLQRQDRVLLLIVGLLLSGLWSLLWPLLLAVLFLAVFTNCTALQRLLSVFRN